MNLRQGILETKMVVLQRMSSGIRPLKATLRSTRPMLTSFGRAWMKFSTEISMSSLICHCKTSRSVSAVEPPTLGSSSKRSPSLIIRISRVNEMSISMSSGSGRYSPRLVMSSLPVISNLCGAVIVYPQRSSVNSTSSCSICLKILVTRLEGRLIRVKDGKLTQFLGRTPASSSWRFLTSRARKYSRRSSCTPLRTLMVSMTERIAG